MIVMSLSPKHLMVLILTTLVGIIKMGIIWRILEKSAILMPATMKFPKIRLLNLTKFRKIRHFNPRYIITRPQSPPF